MALFGLSACTEAIGGDHDAPSAGDMLCSALAACMDSMIRMVADHLGVTLKAG